MKTKLKKIKWEILNCKGIEFRNKNNIKEGQHFSLASGSIGLTFWKNNRSNGVSILIYKT